jgi:hypothetical protein
MRRLLPIVAVAVASSGDLSLALAADAPAPKGPTFDDADLTSAAEPVVTYKLHATLDPAAHTVHGTGTIAWTNRSKRATSELWLHLYLNAFKNERSTFIRDPIGGFRGGRPVKDWGTIDVRKLVLTGEGEADLWAKAELHREGDTDETDVRVPLPREIAVDESVQLEVVWDAKLPSVVERTGYEGSFHMVAQWFPKLARLEPNGTWAHFPFHHLAEFYADFGSYDVTLDVPEAFTLGATGPVTESKVEGGRRVERHVQENVHDFAWTAYDKWQRASEKIDGVDVTFLYPPGYGAPARREMATMRFALPYYGQRYGKYPYSVLTVVHPPEAATEAGGMEYPTLITTGGPWHGYPGVLATELVTIHELGHQWFYGLLASNEAAWPFLDEGLNSYAEQEALTRWLGPGTMVDALGLTLGDAAAQGAGSLRAAHNARVAQPAASFHTGRDYGRLVYGRTCALLETLRRVYGDEPMARAMGTYARRWRFRHPTPEDFLDVVREVLGEHAAGNLRVGLFDKGWVDYLVTSIANDKARDPAGIFDRDGKRETVKEGAKRSGYEGWVLVQRRGTLAFPVDVELTFDDGSTRRVRWDIGAKGADPVSDEALRIPTSGAVALRGAVVDPDHAVLVDDHPSNNHALAPGGRGRGLATLERAAYWAATAVQAVAP